MRGHELLVDDLYRVQSLRPAENAVDDLVEPLGRAQHMPALEGASRDLD